MSTPGFEVIFFLRSCRPYVSSDHTSHWLTVEVTLTSRRSLTGFLRSDLRLSRTPLGERSLPNGRSVIS